MFLLGLPPSGLFFGLLIQHFLWCFWRWLERDTWTSCQSWEHWRSYLRASFWERLRGPVLRYRCECPPWSHFCRVGRCTLLLWHRDPLRKIFLLDVVCRRHRWRGGNTWEWRKWQQSCCCLSVKWNREVLYDFIKCSIGKNLDREARFVLRRCNWFHCYLWVFWACGYWITLLWCFLMSE